MCRTCPLLHRTDICGVVQRLPRRVSVPQAQVRFLPPLLKNKQYEDFNAYHQKEVVRRYSVGRKEDRDPRSTSDQYEIHFVPRQQYGQSLQERQRCTRIGMGQRQRRRYGYQPLRRYSVLGGLRDKPPRCAGRSQRC